MKRYFSLLVASSILLAATTSLGAIIFSDDFETGTVDAWALVAGLFVPADPYRISDLDLRDPHLFVDAIITCFDFTDNELPAMLGPSFNDTLEAAITTDDDGDTLLDASTLLLFRPLDEAAAGERLDIRSGDCTDPIGTTTCTATTGTATSMLTYDALASGMCLTTEPGTTSGYLPTIDEPVAPCFSSRPQDLVFSFGGLEVTLEDAQIGGAFVGSPPTSFSSGLIRGFLSEASADSILIPAEIPVVGGQPFSILLPGGTGNCSGDDDRDLHNGVSGWWFYLNFVADEVPFTE